MCNILFESGGTMYKAEIENKGDSKYYASTKDYSFVLDTEGQGANPIDTLLAGLCGCIGHQIRIYMQQHRVDCKGFAITAEAELTQTKDRLGGIMVSIDLKDTNLDNQQYADVLAYAGKCKIHAALKPGCDIKVVVGSFAGIKNGR